MFSFNSRLAIFFLSSAVIVHAAPRYWDGATPAGDPNGGAGTWNTTTVNWDTAETGGTGVAWTTNDAFFGGTGGLVTLGSTVSAGTLNFTAVGYGLAVNTRTLTVTGGAFSAIPGNVFTVTGTSGTAIFSGAGNLVNTQAVSLGSGNLQLHYDSTGGPLGEAELILGGGTLRLRRDGANDSAFQKFVLKNRVRVTGAVTINVDRTTASGGSGKMLQLAGLTIGTQTLTTTATNSFSLGFENVLLEGNATILTSGDALLGPVSEAGGARLFTKDGAGVLTFREPSDWTGGLLVANGTAVSQASGAFGSGLVSIGAGTAASGVTFSRSSTVDNDIKLTGSSGARTLSVKGGTVRFFGGVAMEALAATIDVEKGANAMLSGSVSGSKVLTKSGAGSLTISGPGKDFGTGLASSIIVTGGRIVVDGDSLLGKPGNGVRLNGGGLHATGPFDTDRKLDVVGTSNFVEVGEGFELGFVSQGVSGAGGFSKLGKGTLRLDVAATTSGAITLGDGELKSTAATSPFGTGVLRLNYGLLSLNPLSDTAATATLSTGAVTYGGAVRVVVDNFSLTPGFSGVTMATLSTGALTRVDRGTITVSAASGIDLLGAPSGDGARWRVPSITTSIPFYPPHLIVTDTDVDSTPHFARYSTTNGFLSASANYFEGFNPSSSAEIADVTAETLSANESVLAARIGDSLMIDDNITLTIAPTSSIAGIILHGAGEIRGGRLSFGTREAIVYVSAAQSAIESDIVTTAPAGGFTKSGPGSLELIVVNGNSNLGEVSVHEGVLAISDIAALGVGTEAVRLGIAEFSYLGPVAASLGRPLIIGPSGGAVVTSTSADFTLDQPISGGISGGLALKLSGGDTINLTNSSNSFAGDILLDGTESKFAGPGDADPTIFGTGQKDIVVTNAGRLTLISGIYNPAPDTKRLVVDGIAEIEIQSGAVIFDSPNQIAGAGTLRILGNGTIELGEGQGDFSANIVVSGGELIVSGSITGSVQGSADTIVSGTGRMGFLDLVGGGTVSPGSTALGRLMVDGMSFTPEATAQFGLEGIVPGSEYDSVIVLGDVNLGGANFALTSTAVPTLFDDIFYLILNDGIDPVVGTFGRLNGIPTDLAQGAVFELGAVSYQISYTSESGIGFEGVGNDVAIRSVPEPGSCVFLCGGLMIAMTTRRRRNSHW